MAMRKESTTAGPGPSLLKFLIGSGGSQKPQLMQQMKTVGLPARAGTWKGYSWRVRATGKSDWLLKFLGKQNGWLQCKCSTAAPVLRNKPSKAPGITNLTNCNRTVDDAKRPRYVEITISQRCNDMCQINL